MPSIVAAIAISILAYHQVEPVPQSGWSVSSDDFRDQMAYLTAAGFHVVSIADASDYLSGRRDSLPANPVVITVDDGFADAYSEIAPVLAKLHAPWSLYVYPQIVGHGRSALTWKQIVELSESGVDIESHTMTHPHLMRKSHPEMTGNEYAEWLHRELAESKRIIEEKTGRPVRFLAYPYGDYDRGVGAEAARDGYALGLLSWAGPNTRETNPFELRRVPMTSATTLAEFARSLGALLIALNAISPAANAVGEPRTIGAVLAHPADVDPSTVRMALLGESGESHYDASTGRVTLTIARYTRSRHTLIVSALRAADRRPMCTMSTFYASSDAKAHDEEIAEQKHDLPLHRVN